MTTTRAETILVTGASSGLGREIARQLAAEGASLVLACRDAEAGAELAEELAESHPGVRAEVRQVDVSSPASVRALAHRLARDGRTLDALVNNAGVHAPGRRPSPEGLELTFATNVLGYFCVARELLPLLEAGAQERGGRPARIVNVASTYVAPPDLEDPLFEKRRYHGALAYRESKAADRMLTRAMARRWTERGVVASSMAPGLVLTNLFRSVGPLTGIAVRLAALVAGKSPAQGADTAVWLATGPREVQPGGFHVQRAERPCEFTDEAREDRLWEICEGLAARAGSA